ncbi:major capsid protein [Parageobacillus thermoglucosidasius]|uniref:major capsid protein n=1 Tax=Parageobacillus thermoglucosidasius TaxID=1426 RepID=UPI000E191521|nr:phage capsid protein [Parageobacillus thermoglucosidasius]MED4904118.1 phage capsid protein [Parageobacillus thermoglucosidasius]MED4915668.1 phage capsid protein [Parageobacillus thermoglucosidasius]MED4945067.1 phage capsid protein [Parageobacillus thermoglucosidasius]MED4983736.1 phage capsid protein [Parageobacillus thermoglucosidasius]RDE19324.1 phage capsid protein [Parageobacillus thermoglucosidasius]
MPITLEQAKVGMADKVDQQVVDEFRRSSLLLDRLVFDNAVSPGTGGSTLTYGYQRLKTPSTAQFRDINQEYTPQEADREDIYVKLKIFGGAFQIDRVIQDTSGQIDEMQFQLQQKIIGARNLFHYTVINGDSAVDSKAFDGLNKALAGSSTELNTDGVIDVSTAAAIEADKFALLDAIDSFLAELDGRPTMLMGNGKLITKIKSVARRAGYLTQSEDAFGRTVQGYDGIPLVDLGYFVQVSGGTPTTVPVVPIVERTIGGTATSGLTDLYAVSIGLDGFHGVTVTGNAVIRTYLPDFDTPGAVKTGEVEMVAAIALKATRKAGVLRNIKVA